MAVCGDAACSARLKRRLSGTVPSREKDGLRRGSRLTVRASYPATGVGPNLVVRRVKGAGAPVAVVEGRDEVVDDLVNGLGYVTQGPDSIPSVFQAYLDGNAALHLHLWIRARDLGNAETRKNCAFFEIAAGERPQKSIGPASSLGPKAVNGGRPEV